MARTASADSHNDTGQGILAAALEVFSEHGFEGARTREIAARADVNLGLLQYYFGGKDKLWRAAVERAFGQLSGGLDAILDDAGPTDERERLQLLIRAYVRFAARNPEFVRIMHDEGKRRGPRMRWLVDHHVKPLFDSIAGLCEAAQKRDFLPSDVPPTHLVYAFVGAVGIIFHQAEECQRLSGVDPASSDAIAAHTRTIEHLFLGAWGAEEVIR